MASLRHVITYFYHSWHLIITYVLPLPDSTITDHSRLKHGSSLLSAAAAPERHADDVLTRPPFLCVCVRQSTAMETSTDATSVLISWIPPSTIAAEVGRQGQGLVTGLTGRQVGGWVGGRYQLDPTQHQQM